MASGTRSYVPILISLRSACHSLHITNQGTGMYRKGPGSAQVSLKGLNRRATSCNAVDVALEEFQYLTFTLVQPLYLRIALIVRCLATS
jgi:hypothetical protein